MLKSSFFLSPTNIFIFIYLLISAIKFISFPKAITRDFRSVIRTRVQVIVWSRNKPLYPLCEQDSTRYLPTFFYFSFSLHWLVIEFNNIVSSAKSIWGLSGRSTKFPMFAHTVGQFDHNQCTHILVQTWIIAHVLPFFHTLKIRWSSKNGKYFDKKRIRLRCGKPICCPIIFNHWTQMKCV